MSASLFPVLASIVFLGAGPSPIFRKAADAGVIKMTSSARASYELGVRLINDKDYKGAVKALTEAIEADPDLALAFVARGSAHLGLHKFQLAAADYEKGLALDPSKASPLYGLGEANRNLNRPHEAKAFYERYATSNASDVRPLLQEDARKKAANLQ